VDRIGQAVDEDLHLAGDAVDVHRRGEDQGVGLDHPRIRGGEIVVEDTGAVQAATVAGDAGGDPQVGEVDEVHLGPGVCGAVEHPARQFSRPAPHAPRASLHCTDLHEQSIAGRKNKRRVMERSLLLPLIEFLHLGEGAAACDLGPHPLLVLLHLEGAAGDLVGPLLRDDDDAALVGDDPVAGPHRLAAAGDLGVDLPEALRLLGVRNAGAGEEGELQGPDIVDVPGRTVDDHPGDPAVDRAPGREFAPGGDVRG